MKVWQTTIGRKCTPSTLDEAIQDAICIGPLCEVPESGYHVIKDFIAQKMGVAYLRADENKELLIVLEELFESLTKRTTNKDLVVNTGKGG